MTIEQWKALKAGDMVFDTHSQRMRRIYSIARISGTRGQKASDVRVALSVTNLKSPGSRTTIFTSDNLGPRRFEFGPPEKP